MTEKLYMENSYLSEIESKVLLNRNVNGKFHIILDKTIFYPDGAGGQRGDKGTINGINIESSFEKDGKIIHVTNEKVSGSIGLIKIDWDYRFHIMQQHTAQHLVSACFHRLFGIPTLNFHASEDSISIDLDVDRLNYEDVKSVEDLANTIVQYNFPIKTYFPDEEDQCAIDFRKDPKVEDNLRVVEIDSFDFAACGGTHVKFTGELGLIKVTEFYRQNGKARIKVLVGKESLRDYSIKNQIFHNLAEKLSANEDNIIEKFDSNIEANTELLNDYNKLKDSFFQILKENIKAKTEKFGEWDLIIDDFSQLGFSNANAFSKYFEDEDVILILFQQKQEMVNFIIKPCGKAELNLELLMNKLRNTFNLKGGGNKKVLQGVIFVSKGTDIPELFRNELINL